MSTTCWLPDGPGHLLITSRSPAWAGVAEPVGVDVFTRAESLALLRTHLPRHTDEDADRLADALGDLPLAIGQAADLLAETPLSVGVYLDQLAAHAAEVMAGGLPSGYPVPLAATVAVAAERLRESDPAAAQLLELCAFLGPEPIPADLFIDHPRLLPAPLSSVADRPIAFARTVAQLTRYGLARSVGDGLILHRLTQAVLRDHDPDPATRRKTVEDLLIVARPGDAVSPAGWPRWAQLLPHLLVCEPAASSNLEICRASIDAVWHLLARGDARTALPLAENLHTAWTERRSPDDELSLAAATTRAYAYSQLDRPDLALQLAEDV